MINEPQRAPKDALDLGHVEVERVAIRFAQHYGNGWIVVCGKLDFGKPLCYVVSVCRVVHVRILKSHPGLVAGGILMEGGSLDMASAVNTKLPAMKSITESML